MFRLLRFFIFSLLFLFSLPSMAAWSSHITPLWPNGDVVYKIDQSLAENPIVLARLYNAMGDYERDTVVRFVERTDVNASQYTNYVTFTFDSSQYLFPYAYYNGMTKGERV